MNKERRDHQWHIKPTQTTEDIPPRSYGRIKTLILLSGTLLGMVLVVVHPVMTTGAQDTSGDNVVYTLSQYSAQHVPLLVTARAQAVTMYPYGDDGFLSADMHFTTTGTGGTEATVFGEISLYIVHEGDTLSEIAEMFNVSSDTILWANDIDDIDVIQPGVELVILPINGVTYTVEKGDTLNSLVKRFGGSKDEILAYNHLSENTALTIGKEVVIPNGRAVTHDVGTKVASGKTGTRLINPIPTAIKSQGIHGYNAVDLAAPVGTPIRAAASGTVVLARAGGYNGGYGSYVVLRHSDGTQTLYAHMSKVLVSTGETVSQGEKIGLVGNTGRSTGPHLHFEVRGGVNPF